METGSKMTVADRSALLKVLFVAQAQRIAAVIPKIEKFMSDWAHTWMPAKKTVVKATMLRMKTGIIIVLGNSFISRRISFQQYPRSARLLFHSWRGLYPKEISCILIQA